MICVHFQVDISIINMIPTESKMKFDTNLKLFLLAKFKRYYLIICFGVVALYTVLLLRIRNQPVSSKYRYALDKCTECTVYNLSMPNNADYDCIAMKYTPPALICLYPTDKDIQVSYSLKDTGQWEPGTMKVFQKWLSSDPDIGVIDVGANIGVYSIVAAAMDHTVVAVEPNGGSLKRFHKSVKLGGFEHHVTVLRNAVGDKRGFVNIVPSADNQGDTRISEQVMARGERNLVNMIVMDDLLKYCIFRKAVMKIDIQGYEHKAFVHADAIFDVIDIVYVIMEWREILLLTRSSPNGSRDIVLVENMIKFFIDRRYKSRDLFSNDLDINTWRDWPDDIIWVK